ncbi:MAG: zinc ribbon domain-containing protein [Ruminococcus sp.]|nr:zinc ribbon domain-containing protein [Ruminococcus sp.]
MFCTYCGGEIRAGSEYCTKCGSPVAPEYIPQPQQPRRGVRVDFAEPMQIRCVSCNEIIGDELHKVNNCPRCGAPQGLNIAVDTGSVYTGQTAMPMSAGYGGDIGMPPDVPQEQNRARKWIKRAAIAAAAVVLCAVIAIGALVASSVGHEEIIWPASGLSRMIPAIGETGEIYNDSSDIFSADIYDISKAAFGEYVEQCKAEGFDVDVVKNSDSFYAYNSEGYKLSLDYYGNELTIRITAPIAMRKITLASNGLGGLLPALPSDTGFIENEGSDYLYFYLGDVTREDYDAFVTACIQNGFNEDYSRSGDYFRGENEDGVDLNIQYLGNNTIEIRLYD